MVGGWSTISARERTGKITVVGDRDLGPCNWNVLDAGQSQVKTASGKRGGREFWYLLIWNLMSKQDWMVGVYRQMKVAPDDVYLSGVVSEVH